MSVPAFPWRFDTTGSTAQPTADDHVRQMIEILLFTEAGERVMRPDLGSGVQRLVFGAASPEVASALQFVIAANLDRWLGDLVRVDHLAVDAVDATLHVDLRYTVLRTGEERTASFDRSAP